MQERSLHTITVDDATHQPQIRTSLSAFAFRVPLARVSPSAVGDGPDQVGGLCEWPSCQWHTCAGLSMETSCEGLHSWMFASRHFVRAVAGKGLVRRAKMTAVDVSADRDRQHSMCPRRQKPPGPRTLHCRRSATRGDRVLDELEYLAMGRWPGLPVVRRAGWWTMEG